MVEKNCKWNIYAFPNLTEAIGEEVLIIPIQKEHLINL